MTSGGAGPASMQSSKPSIAMALLIASTRIPRGPKSRLSAAAARLTSAPVGAAYAATPRPPPPAARPASWSILSSASSVFPPEAGTPSTMARLTGSGSPPSSTALLCG